MAIAVGFVLAGLLFGICVLIAAHRWHAGSRCMTCGALFGSLKFNYFDRCPVCGAGKFEDVTLRRRRLFGVDVK
jgi:hypothetical protein